MRRYLIAILLLFFGMPFCLQAQWNVDRLLRIGTDAIYYEDNSRAIEHFNRVIRLRPHLYEPYFYRGYAKLGLDDLSGAITDFTKAIDLNPNYLFAYIYRGVSYYQAGRYEEALEDYREALELAPSNPAVYTYRGLAYRALSEDKLAEKDFSKSIHLDPDFQLAYLNRAELRVQHGNSRGAMEDCNAVIRRNIFSHEAYGLRGYINKLEGNIHDAVEDFNRGINASPENMQLRMHRALLYYEEGEFYEALADYDEMLSIDSNYIYGLYNRALLRLELGATNDAIDDFSRVIELNPENIIVYFNRGLAYQSIKDYTSAYNDFSSCIALYPDFVKAYYARASLLMDMGREKLAMEDSYAASQIMERYREMKRGVAGAYVDTTENLTRLLDLNDRNSAVRNMVSGSVSDRISSIRLKGIHRVTLLPKDSLHVTTSDKYESSIVKYNNQYGDDFMLTIASSPLIKGVEMLNAESDAELLFAGVALLDSDDYMKAIECFKRVSPDSEWYGLAQFSLGNAIAMMYAYIEAHAEEQITLGVKSSRTIDYSEVWSAYDECMRCIPDFIYVRYNKAGMMAESGMVTEAIALLDDVIDAQPNFADAYFNRGIMNLYVGDKRRAISDLSKAGELGISDAYEIIKRYGSDF